MAELVQVGLQHKTFSYRSYAVGFENLVLVLDVLNNKVFSWCLAKLVLGRQVLAEIWQPGLLLFQIDYFIGQSTVLRSLGVLHDGFFDLDALLKLVFEANLLVGQLGDLAHHDLLVQQLLRPLGFYSHLAYVGSYDIILLVV